MTTADWCAGPGLFAVTSPGGTPRRVVECLQCGGRRVVSGIEGECPVCEYVGWRSVEESETAAADPVTPPRPPVTRSVRAEMLVPFRRIAAIGGSVRDLGVRSPRR